MDPLQQRVAARVEECYQRAERHFNCRFARPNISFRQRGKIAGSARLQGNELRFHPLLLQQNSEHFIEHVVPHEISHLLTWQRHGRVAPHGREWQRIMVEVFDLPPLRTHNYDTSALGQREFAYQCGCGPVMLSIRRHNKVLRGTLYQCRRCKQSLYKASADT